MTRTIPNLAPAPVSAGQAESITKGIENQATNVSSDLWLIAAVAAIGTSFYYQMNEKHDQSRFIGQWVAPFLLLGVYSKLAHMVVQRGRVQPAANRQTSV